MNLNFIKLHKVPNNLITNTEQNMKKSISLFLALLIFSSCCFCGAAVDTDIPTDNTAFAVKTAEIIKDADNQPSMLRIIGKSESKLSDSAFPLADAAVISDDGRFVLQFSSEEKLLSCLEELKNTPNIIYAEKDRPIYTETLEDAAEYVSWGVEAIEANVYAESLSVTAENPVTVAIIDSGSQNIDFIKDRLVEGYDFVENDKDAAEDESSDSHGTFLASIVADCCRNIPVKIMPVRVLKSKTGSLINAINGIRFAVDNGADVINISLGGVLDNCKPLDDALSYAEQNNVTVVVCAGNVKRDIENYCPAHNESAITVTSVNRDNEFSESFSNFGTMVDFAAPGENIVGYNASGEKTTLSGTSMSAAFVSAAAAMFRMDNPRCNTNQVRKAMISCAVDCGEYGHDIYYGWGVLKLGALAASDEKYVESVSFDKSGYSLVVGERLKISPVFSPADSTDKSFTLSTDSSNIMINADTVTAVSEGTAMLIITSNDGFYTDTVEITVKEKEPDIIAKLKIKNNTGEKTIDYGETLRLNAEITDKPENTSVWWYVNGNRSGEGETFDISLSSGSVNVTAKLVDTNGVSVTDKDGNEISDCETVSVNDGFFKRIISFFKNLFGINRTVVQTVFKAK